MNRRNVHIVTSAEFAGHDTGGDDHPETQARLEAVISRISDLSWITPHFHEPAPAARDILLAVHDESYLFRFEETVLMGKGWLDHPDNRISEATYQAALLAAGGVTAGIDLIEGRNLFPVISLVRPPGHHAERSQALGFCFLNNVAVGVRYWQLRHQRQRIAVVDWDAHHGNGIEAAFETDPQVLYVSIHEHPTWSFPGTGWKNDRGSGAGYGTTINIPIPPGSGDEVLREAVTTLVEPAIEVFAPEAVIIAAGFDAHVDDDMSGLAYETKTFHFLGRRAADWSALCEGRLLSVLEGGYHLPSLSDGFAAFLQGLCNQ